LAFNNIIHINFSGSDKVNKKTQFNIAIHDPLVVKLCKLLRSRGQLGRIIEQLLYDNYADILKKEQDIIELNKTKKEDG